MPWPSCGEIDLMEYYRINGVPHILANACWGNDQPYKAVWNSKKTPFAHFTEKDPAWAQHFHIWRMDWDETAIRLYLDDELLNTWKDLSARLEEQKSAAEEAAEATPPMRYEIDYVRVYQKK